MTNAALIAERLGLTACSDEFVGGCPCCGYETGFSVVDKGERTLFHCHAGGCTQQAIIQALRETGLWENRSGDNVEFPARLPIAHPPPLRKSGSAEYALEM
jgi:hypothetical protein